MITIDGSLGEGGGQILRTSLGLSMMTGKAFRIEKIRARREKPGLLRQHLTAVNAATEICGATVVGANIGSRELEFIPGPVKPGDYRFAIGSAGSTTLVLQAILPALLCASGPTNITLEGGTHNPHAPPLEFLEHAFLPIINRMGPRVSVSLERAGFYPAGGGRVFAYVEPAAQFSPIVLESRGQTTRRLAKAVACALPGDIAKRELKRIEKMLGWSGDELQIRQLPEDQGPGNVLTLMIQSEHITEVFTGFGMKGVTAEAVAEVVIQEVRRYLAATVPVGRWLADQLLIPFALSGGGGFVTQELTEHATTNIQVIQQFIHTPIATEKDKKNAFRVCFGRPHEHSSLMTGAG